MRLRDAETITADAGPILLDLASRVQSMPLGPGMATAIRRDSRRAARWQTASAPSIITSRGNQ